MQKTIKTLFLLTIITGTFLTGCGPTIENPTVNQDTSGAVVEDEGETAEPMKVDVKVNGSGTVEIKEVKTEKATTKYKDGAYNSTGTYASPAGQESITVSITIEDDKVKAMTIGTLASNETSKMFQDKFQLGVGAMVIGKPIEEIGGYAQVNGSSLTPKGFDNALATIKVSAKNS